MQVDHLRGRRVGCDADTGEVRWTFQIPRPVNAAVTLTAVGLVPVQSKTVNLPARWNPQNARSLTNGENLCNAKVRSFLALLCGNGSC